MGAGEKSGSLDAEAVRNLNAAIAGYIHDDATRKAILGESNIEDSGSIKDAVNLNLKQQDRPVFGSLTR